MIIGFLLCLLVRATASYPPGDPLGSQLAHCPRRADLLEQILAGSGDHF
ncbi:MAG: hypothetical protein WAM94_10085 [Chromatiaceae bacterium]